jgi:adenylylsulfate kinase-like enzyme
MAIFWLTGMPCSGKTTVGRALVERLGDVGRVACLIDGDVVRRGELSRGLGFSAADRRENVRRVADVADRLARDVDVVVAMVSPTEQIREPARALPGLVMVGLHCPPQVARQRDFKGVYRRAWDAASYEPPTPADSIIDTSRASVAQCVDQVLRAARIADPESPVRSAVSPPRS